MAIGIVVKDKQDVGLGETVAAQITLDSSYPTGGEPVTAKELGFRVGSRLHAMDLDCADGHVFEFVPDATLKDRGKILAFIQDGNAGKLVEVADTTDLSAVTARVTAHGR